MELVDASEPYWVRGGYKLQGSVYTLDKEENCTSGLSMQSPAVLSVYKVRENPVGIKTLPCVGLHATFCWCTSLYEDTCLNYGQHIYGIVYILQLWTELQQEKNIFITEPGCICEWARHQRAYHHQNTDGFTLGDRLIPICFVKRVLNKTFGLHTYMYNTIPCMPVIVFWNYTF